MSETISFLLAWKHTQTHTFKLIVGEKTHFLSFSLLCNQKEIELRVLCLVRGGRVVLVAWYKKFERRRHESEVKLREETDWSLPLASFLSTSCAKRKNFVLLRTMDSSCSCEQSLCVRVSACLCAANFARLLFEVTSNEIRFAAAAATIN